MHRWLGWLWGVLSIVGATRSLPCVLSCVFLGCQSGSASGSAGAKSWWLAHAEEGSQADSGPLCHFGSCSAFFFCWCNSHSAAGARQPNKTGWHGTALAVALCHSAGFKGVGKVRGGDPYKSIGLAGGPSLNCMKHPRQPSSSSSEAAIAPSLLPAVECPAL